MHESIVITSTLALEQRPALEELLFFNANQHRVRNGIEHSIEAYGAPEIHAQDGALRIRIGNLGVQSLFAVSAAGRPVGVAVFVHLTDERFVVLHLGVAPGLDAAARNSTILLKLMHEIRRLARRTHGVNHIELVYTQGPANQAANRLHGIFAPG